MNKLLVPVDQSEDRCACAEVLGSSPNEYIGVQTFFTHTTLLPSARLGGLPKSGALESISDSKKAVPPPIQTQRCGSIPQEPISAGSIILLLRTGIASIFRPAFCIRNPCQPPQKQEQEAAACLIGFFITHPHTPHNRAAATTYYRIARRARSTPAKQVYGISRHGDGEIVAYHSGERVFSPSLVLSNPSQGFPFAYFSRSLFHGYSSEHRKMTYGA